MTKLNTQNKKARLNIRMNIADYVNLKAQATESHLTITDYVLSKLGLHDPAVSKFDHQIFEQLFKCHNDLARLGNLFKLAIDQDTYAEDELLKLFDEIVTTKTKIEDLIQTCIERVKQ